MSKTIIRMSTDSFGEAGEGRVSWTLEIQLPVYAVGKKTYKKEKRMTKRHRVEVIDYLSNIDMTEKEALAMAKRVAHQFKDAEIRIQRWQTIK